MTKWIILLFILFTGCDLSPKMVILPIIMNNFDDVIEAGHQQPGTPFIKEDIDLFGVMESTPFVFKGKYYIMLSLRGLNPENLTCTQIRAIDGKNEIISQIGYNTFLSSALVVSDTLYIYANEGFVRYWVFYTKDMITWNSNICFQPIENNKDRSNFCYNCSVCFDGTNFMMTWEKDLKFCVAESDSGTNFICKNSNSVTGGYSACPTIRFYNGFYYVFYLNAQFNTVLTRTSNFINWEDSPRNPILYPEKNYGEDVNTSDMDLVEWNGETHLYYSVSDQKTYAKVRRAKFNGPLNDLLKWTY